MRMASLCASYNRKKEISKKAILSYAKRSALTLLSFDSLCRIGRIVFQEADEATDS